MNLTWPVSLKHNKATSVWCIFMSPFEVYCGPGNHSPMSMPSTLSSLASNIPEIDQETQGTIGIYCLLQGFLGIIPTIRKFPIEVYTWKVKGTSNEIPRETFDSSYMFLQYEEELRCEIIRYPSSLEFLKNQLKTVVQLYAKKNTRICGSIWEKTTGCHHHPTEDTETFTSLGGSFHPYCYMHMMMEYRWIQHQFLRMNSLFMNNWSTKKTIYGHSVSLSNCRFKQEELWLILRSLPSLSHRKMVKLFTPQRELPRIVRDWGFTKLIWEAI